MNTQWKEFLKAAGAQIEENRVTNFGEQINELEHLTGSTKILCDLSNFALIEVTGEDALEFLHNQTCNDARALKPGQSQLTAVCHPKGRILFGFQLIRQVDKYLLRIPAELAEPVIKRLGMFVLRSRVEFENLTGESVAIGYYGDQADSHLATTLGIDMPAIGATVNHGGLLVMRIPGEKPRFEIHGPVDAVQAAWANLKQDALPCSSDLWTLMDIRAGLPQIYAGTQDSFIPQMVNYQALDGLSFTKGCYPGQEVVARLHYLGKLKRSMVRGRLKTETPLAPGDELVSADSSSGQWAGKIVDVIAIEPGQNELLAVVLNDVAETGQLSLEGNPDNHLELLPLPYKIQDD